MDEKMIPYFSHEGDMSRMERANKRLWVVILILIVALVGSNGAWIWYESQFQVVEEKTEIEQDVKTDDGDAVVSGIGDINYGTSEAENN